MAIDINTDYLHPLLEEYFRGHALLGPVGSDMVLCSTAMLLHNTDPEQWALANQQTRIAGIAVGDTPTLALLRVIDHIQSLDRRDMERLITERSNQSLDMEGLVTICNMELLKDLFFFRVDSTYLKSFGNYQHLVSLLIRMSKGPQQKMVEADITQSAAKIHMVISDKYIDGASWTRVPNPFPSVVANVFTHKDYYTGDFISYSDVVNNRDTFRTICDQLVAMVHLF